MKLDKNTRIQALTEEFPFLVEDLVTHNNAFKKLKNPVVRKTAGRFATIEKAAKMAQEDTLDLLLFLAGKIMATTGKNIEIRPPARQKHSTNSKPLIEIVPPEVQKQSSPVGGLSDRQRMEALKQILHDLHNGGDIRALKYRFQQTVGGISHQEVAALEQSLVKEGIPETEIKKMCDLHVELLQEPLEKNPRISTRPGHPVHTYMEENRRAGKCANNLLQKLDKIGNSPAEDVWTLAVKHLNQLLNELKEIFIHYTRKENQLFPMLERHGIDAPPKVMWEIHDDIRTKYHKAEELLKGQNSKIAVQVLKDFATMVNEMILKEEMVLLPMALEILDEEDWARSRKGDDEIGYAFGVIPGNEWHPEPLPACSKQTAPSDSVNLSTGILPLEVINSMLCCLPVDLSFVDAENRVAYYSDSKHRIFPRSPEVIGRDVKNCHPPKSVHIVNKILESFQRGERDKAEFWLELGGKFIHIQYLALHGTDGQYLGCLEIGQDATYLRSLTGEQRLPEWS